MNIRLSISAPGATSLSVNAQQSQGAQVIALPEESAKGEQAAPLCPLSMQAHVQRASLYIAEDFGLASLKV